MYKVHIFPKARREIKKISENHQKAVILALRELKEDPLAGKPLIEELTGKFSYRIGVYRIIYKINEKDKIVTILTAGHRSTVYQ
jgi:mRNA interferase RelE/StbE